jgi:inosine-uridine nucleoside N-ribohydrolase
MTNERKAASMLAAVAVELTLAGGCKTTSPLPGSGLQMRLPSGPPIILDTDIATDVDDAGALAVLHALAGQGEARILAVMSCNRNQWSVPAIDVINTYYGRSDVPVGATRTGPDDERWYHDVVSRFPRGLASGGHVPEAVSLYRRILAAQPVNSVTIVTIGWLTNVADLLSSGPDGHSALTGKELALARVKELVAMGGVWPNTQGQGDYNFGMDRSAAHKVINNWPGPIMFTGLGVDVMTGGRLMAEGPTNNPVRTFYGGFLKANKATQRSSWDQIAVLYAVRGLSNYFTAIGEGQCVAQPDGSCEWLPGRSRKNHRYLAYRMPQAELATVIEDLMLIPPRHKLSIRGTCLRLS